MITLTQKSANRIKQYQNQDTTHKRGRKPFIIPKGVLVDWNQTNREIATQFNTTPMTILLLRKRLGIDALPKGRPHLKKENVTMSQLKEAMNLLYEQLSKNLK